jgi:ketosteroid isomerase-like protein
MPRLHVSSAQRTPGAVTTAPAEGIAIGVKPAARGATVNDAGNIALVKRAYEALEADEVDRFLEFCSRDIDWVYPSSAALSYGGHWHGHEGVRRFLEAHDSAEEILEFVTADVVAGRDKVVVQGHYKGRVKPAGGEWETDFMHVLTVREGKITRFTAAFDTAAAAAARTTADK